MKWVVIDYGEVVCRRPPKDVAARLPALLGAQPGPFWDAYWSQRRAYDLGAVDAARYWDQVCGYLGHVASTDLLDTLIGLDLDMWSHLDPGTLRVLADLTAKRVPLALLSNAPLELARDIERRPWARLFRRRFFSADLSLVKPDPRIYRHVSDALATAPGDLVFVDDRQENIDGALEAGFRAHLFTGADRLRHDLELPAA